MCLPQPVLSPFLVELSVHEEDPRAWCRRRGRLASPSLQLLQLLTQPLAPEPRQRTVLCSFGFGFHLTQHEAPWALAQWFS